MRGKHSSRAHFTAGALELAAAVKEDPESPSNEQGLGPVLSSSAASGAAREAKRRRLGHSGEQPDQQAGAGDDAGPGAGACGAAGGAAGHGATAGTGAWGGVGDAAGTATAALVGPGDSRPLYVGRGAYRRGRLHFLSGVVERLWPHLWDQLQEDRRAARARRRPGVRNETTAERDVRVFVQQREWSWVDGQQRECVVGAQAVDVGLRYQAGWCLSRAKHVLAALGMPLGLHNKVEEPRLLLARLADGRVVAAREADEGQGGWWELPCMVGKEEAGERVQGAASGLSDARQTSAGRSGLPGGGVVGEERKQQQQQEEWDGDDDTEGTEIGTDDELPGDGLLQQAWGADGVDTEGTEYSSSSDDTDGEEAVWRQQHEQQQQKGRGQAATCSRPPRSGAAAAGAPDNAPGGPPQEAPEAMAGGRPHGIRHCGHIYASALILRTSAIPDLWPDVHRCGARGVGARGVRGQGGAGLGGLGPGRGVAGL